MQWSINGIPEDALSELDRQQLAERNARNLEEMFRTGRAPRVSSDTTFRAGRYDDSQVVNPDLYEFRRKVAESQGHSITGKFYMASLARYPGDPEAWIDSKSDVQRVCRKRRQTCEGEVTVKESEFSNDPEEPTEC